MLRYHSSFFYRIVFFFLISCPRKIKISCRTQYLSFLEANVKILFSFFLQFTRIPVLSIPNYSPYQMSSSRPLVCTCAGLGPVVGSLFFRFCFFLFLSVEKKTQQKTKKSYFASFHLCPVILILLHYQGVTYISPLCGSQVLQVNSLK